MKHPRSRTVIPAFLTLGFLLLPLAGCVSSKQAEQQIADADSEAGFNTPETEWSAPPWQGAFGGNGNASPEQESSQSVQQASTAATGSRAVFNAEGKYLTNLAIIGLPQGQVRELYNEATEYGFRIIPPADLTSSIQNTEECAERMTRDCAYALAAYPGARLIALVTDDSQATLIDTSSGGLWQGLDLGATSPGESLLEIAYERSEIGPWAMKPFLADDGRLYLSAGRANGLEEGTTLAVHERGTLVSTPNGDPVTWRAGERVGTARIGELFGSDLASLVPVEGQRPTADHDLILVQE